MTTLIDDIAGPIAADLLADYGVALTITNLSGVAVPGSRGVTTTITSQTVKCSPPYPFRGPFAKGGAVRVGDLTTFVAAQDASRTFNPQAGHKATFNSKSYSVVESNPSWSGEALVGWMLFLRGGAP